MWGDCCIWLHSTQVQQRHQHCRKHIHRNTIRWTHAFHRTFFGVKQRIRGSGSFTSREHDESILQHPVSFASLFVTIFRIQIFLLTEVEMAKWSGERKVWQLGQVSVLLKHKTNRVSVLDLQTDIGHTTKTSWISSETPVFPQFMQTLHTPLNTFLFNYHNLFLAQ